MSPTDESNAVATSDATLTRSHTPTRDSRIRSGAVADSVTARPAICLNMIVRNEAHIVCETLDSVAPYISSWVVVDTGSDDGTQKIICDHMARLGIPGALHERPWVNFGHNRTEAYDLAQRRADYIWVMDADDIVVGTPDFTQLSADFYELRYLNNNMSEVSWRPRLFRDGLRGRSEGVVHEDVVADQEYIGARLGGEYHIEYRQLGARSQDQQKYARDAELLLAEIERNPEDVRSIAWLALCYYALGDFVNTRKWYERRLELGYLRPDEEVFFAMYRIAESMEKLGEPWPDVQDAYLRAWELRPTRAEPLYHIAVHYRVAGHYRLGYLFAERAAEISLPKQDQVFRLELYTWRATDELAVCASQIGRHAEAFMLCRRLLACPGVPDGDRQRIARNRDFSVPAMNEAASSYPDALVGSLVASPRKAEVTVSLIAGPDRSATEQTLNSFLHCCTDVARVGRFLVLDAGLSSPDRAKLQERYGFLEFTSAPLGQLRAQIHGRFWLHLGQGWRFFAPENFITRLSAVLEAEAQVFQVGINFADAVKLTGACAAEQTVRRTPEAGGYVLTDSVASGPAMFDTTRLDQATGLQTATLDEVLCIATVRPEPIQMRDLQSQPGARKKFTYPAHTRFAVAVVSDLAARTSESFREVAEGLHYALLALGHDSVLTNRLDLDERCTIVLSPYLLAHYGLKPPRNPILYNLEQVDSSVAAARRVTPALLALVRRYPVWDYSQANIERLAAWQIPRPTHVPIGFVPELTRIAPAPEDVDVLFYGWISERRRVVLDKLRARGLRVEALQGVYGASRDAWIARSKIVLNIHHYDAKVFEIARVSYLLDNKRAVVSERSSDPTEERDLKSGVAFAEYDELVDRCVELLGDERARHELAERGYQAFSARSQAEILRRALSADAST